MKRRDFLRQTGLAASGLGTVAVATQPAAAQTLSEYRPPEHVTISFDEARLKTYRPWLDLSALEIEPYGLFGQVASSPEYDYDVMVYAARYVMQQGVSPLAPPLNDSHFGDTEWFYVFVDEAGDVAEVVYTAYHWVAKRVVGDGIPLYDGTHPIAHVVRPWHHYVLAGDITGELVRLRDMTNRQQGFEDWLESGMMENLRPGTVRDPATMRWADSWWRDGWDATYAQIFHDWIEGLPVIG